MILAISTFMIECVDPLKLLVELGHISRIADIGIATQHILGSAGRLLTDEIATAGHTMLQGNALDSDATILVDHLSLRGVDRMELDTEAQVVGIELDLMFEF